MSEDEENTDEQKGSKRQQKVGESVFNVFAVSSIEFHLNFICEQMHYQIGMQRHYVDVTNYITLIKNINWL